MKHALLHVLGFVTAALLALGAAPARADAVGPYYATPSWDQTLPASTRFIVLSNFNSAAVLDRETGLVWERSPTAPPNTFTWAEAQLHCNNLSTGNRKGWRLPTNQELASLVDPSVTNPALPAGHPFQNVQSSNYWSATTEAASSSGGWVVNFSGGFLTFGADKSDTFFVWCVRGGQGVDPQ